MPEKPKAPQILIVGEDSHIRTIGSILRDDDAGRRHAISVAIAGGTIHRMPIREEDLLLRHADIHLSIADRKDPTQDPFVISAMTNMDIPVLEDVSSDPKKKVHPFAKFIEKRPRRRK